MSLLSTPTKSTDIFSTQVQVSHGQQQILRNGLPFVVGIGSLSTVSAVVPILMPITMPALLITLPALVIGHAILLRSAIIDPALAHCDTSRRIVTRWSLRLLYWMAALWGYVISSFAPVWGVIIVPTVFAGLTWCVHIYTKWQLDRAKQSLSIHLVEQVFLVLMGLCVVGSVAFAGFMAVSFGLFAALIAAIA